MNAQWIEANELREQLVPFKVLQSVSSILRLPGDGSTRQYFRVFTQADLSTDLPGLTHSSFIIMKTDPFPESLPFLQMQTYLQDRTEIAVPRVFDFNQALGLVVLEDLGDQTLLHRLQAIQQGFSNEREQKLYQEVLDLLIRLQMRGEACALKTDLSLPCFQMRFDEAKLMWEVNYTLEHFYQKYLKRPFTPHALKGVEQSFLKICKHLASEPTVLVHRDYHSRNLMWSKNSWFMIDFQDARLGPLHYDLVSLLRDGYYQLSEPTLEACLDYYWSAIQTDPKLAEKAGPSREAFRLSFDWMAIQRNFKAIGSYASFFNTRGNPSYLKYIGNTFEVMRRIVSKYPEYQELGEILFSYYHF